MKTAGRKPCRFYVNIYTKNQQKFENTIDFEDVLC